jgi:hypothetical protein
MFCLPDLCLFSPTFHLVIVPDKEFIAHNLKEALKIKENCTPGELYTTLPSPSVPKQRSKWNSHLTVRRIFGCEFYFLTVARMKMAVFWIVAPRSLAEFYRLIRGAYCLHHQGDDSGDHLGVTTHKLAIFRILEYSRLAVVKAAIPLVEN